MYLLTPCFQKGIQVIVKFDQKIKLLLRWEVLIWFLVNVYTLLLL